MGLPAVGKAEFVAIRYGQPGWDAAGDRSDGGDGRIDPRGKAAAVAARAGHCAVLGARLRLVQGNSRGRGAL